MNKQIQGLQVVLYEMQILLGNNIGEMVIGGGAVRDALLNKPPKDIDLFILSHGKGKSWGELANIIRPKLTNFTKIKPVVEWHKSEPFLIETIKHNYGEVQIMLRNLSNVDELMDTFDWNVSLFALTENGIVQREDEANISPGKELWTQTITYPKSTLRRGYRFSERFHMKIRKGEIEKICKKVVEYNK